MKRKELIEKNLTLLQSKDSEIKNLILNSLFGDSYNLTLKFENNKHLNSYNNMCSHVKMIIIDTLSGVKLHSYNISDNRGSGDTYLEYCLIFTFFDDFQLTILIDSFLDKLKTKFDFVHPFDLLIEYSFELIINKCYDTDKYSINNLIYKRKSFCEIINMTL